MRPLVDWLARATPDEHQSLCETLQVARDDGTLARIRTVRDYMCHRDHRAFWNDGRRAVFGTHEVAARLHHAFDNLLRSAVQSTGEAPHRFCGEEYWYEILGRGQA